jgi:hypothetical protein
MVPEQINLNLSMEIKNNLLISIMLIWVAMEKASILLKTANIQIHTALPVLIMINKCLIAWF